MPSTRTIKIIILIALCGFLFVCLAIFYNSSTSKQDNSIRSSETPLPETSSNINQTDDDDIFMKNSAECSESAKELFNQMKTTDGDNKASGYIYQFNAEKCYVLTSFSKNDKSIYLRKELNILYSPQEADGAFIGHYTKDKDGEITSCQIRDNQTADWIYCQNEEEFNQLMEDSGYIK
jgi:hypothetical protein